MVDTRSVALLLTAFLSLVFHRKFHTNHQHRGYHIYRSVQGHVCSYSGIWIFCSTMQANRSRSSKELVIAATPEKRFSGIIVGLCLSSLHVEYDRDRQSNGYLLGSSSGLTAIQLRARIGRRRTWPHSSQHIPSSPKYMMKSQNF